MIQKKIIIILLLISDIFGHPHTFIEIYPTIKIEKNKIVDFHFKWIIDDMTSSMLIMEFDQNNDGKIDDKENKYVYDNYFISLKDYNFYTNIKINNISQFFPNIKNFKTTIENNKICYSFDLDTKYDIKNLIFDFGDKDFFVAMILKKEFIQIYGAEAQVSDLDMDFYFGYRLKFKEIK